MPLSRLADWFVLAELNALVEETDLTQQQVAIAIGVSSRTVTNYLIGETRPKAGMAASFAKTCGASEKRADFLSHVIKQLDSGKIVSDLEERNIFIIERAEATYGKFWKWEPWYIPGPLQIERYHMEALAGQDNQPMEQWQRKLRRQVKIVRRNPGPQMRFLIGSNVFQPLAQWDWGPDQFNKLLEFARMPNCEIRVLEGLHRGIEHSFEIYHPADRSNAGPSFVYVEALDQSRHIEESIKIEMYHDRVNKMWSFGTRFGGRLDDWVH